MRDEQGDQSISWRRQVTAATQSLQRLGIVFREQQLGRRRHRSVCTIPAADNRHWVANAHLKAVSE